MSSDLGFRLAGRILGLEISEIVRISERASALKAAGRDILSLATGEPDFPTPLYGVEAAHAAASPAGRYPPTLGSANLRVVVAADAGTTVAEVIMSTGAEQVIANAMLATLGPGDEVDMPAPCWTSCSDIVAMAEGKAVVVPSLMDAAFRLSAAALDAAIAPRTRWLMMNAPSNPAGAVHLVAELHALTAALEKHPRVWVTSDEIRERLNFAHFHRLATVVLAPGDGQLTVNEVSKAWSMTGWRVGWGIGPAELIKAMGAVRGQMASSARSVAQAAALAALTGHRGEIATRREVLRARRDRVVAALNSAPGIESPVLCGAFYVFPRIEGAIRSKSFEDDAGLCSLLLDQAGVALVPGRAFGLPGHPCLSFAYSDEDLGESLARIASQLAA